MSRGRIVAVRVLGTRLPMRLAFRHHQATRTESRAQILEVRLDDGTIGYGEAQPRPYVTGETELTVRAALQDEIGPWLVGEEIADLGAAACLLTGSRAAQWRLTAPAAFGAADLAVLDAAGKRCGRSAVEVLGGRRRGSFAAAGAVIGMMPLAAVRMFAAALRPRAKRWVKIKVGGGDDAARVTTVRQILGAGVELSVDANGAWSRDEAVARSRELASLGVRAVEQPVARDDFDGLVEVSQRAGVAVVADESLCTREDAANLIRRGGRVHWNLRAGKCGGLLGVLELLRLARTHGIGCRLGVMIGETALLRAAGHLVAASSTDFDQIESDEGLMLARDLALPQAEPCADRNRVLVPSGPGLGVQIDPEALRAANWAFDRSGSDLEDLPASA